MQLDLQDSAIAFLAGALLVSLLWSYAVRQHKKKLNLLRVAVQGLVLDARKNAHVENIIARVEMGNKEAMKDWHLINHLVIASFVLCQPPDYIRSVWKRYCQRVTESEIKMAEKTLA